MKRTLISSTQVLTWILASLMIRAAPNAAQAQTFQDSIFTNSDWSSVLLPNSVAGSTFTALQDNTNGNPQPSRTTTHKYPTGDIFVAHLYKQSSPYDPASQGAIVKLSYSYHLSHRTALKVAYSILIYQNSTYYYHVPNDLISGATWMPFSGSNLTAASFTKLDGPSTNVNPDFSCKGSPIVFGYVTRNSNPNPKTTDNTESGIDNWKVSIDDKTTCCGAISAPKVTCGRGVFTYTFTVTNNSAQTIQYLLLSPPFGATYGILPPYIKLTTPLLPGGSTPVSVTITNANPTDHICINVALADAKVVPCCTIQTCVDLPDCPCLNVVDVKPPACSGGSYVYTVSLTNPTTTPVQQIFIVPISPANVNILPSLVTLSTPLQPNQTTIQTLTITGAPPGKVCLRFSPLGENGAMCCSVEKCFVLPPCINPPADTYPQTK